MSAASGHPSLRARIAANLANLLGRQAHSSIAESLGCAQTTVSRRSDDLHAWPADDLLRLAVDDADLGAAVITYLRGDHEPSGDPMRSTGRARAFVTSLARTLAQVANDLEDGRIDASEAHALRPSLRQLLNEISSLDRDLAAMETR